MKKLFAKGYVEKAEDNGVLQVAIASDNSVDRDGERIDANGWDFQNFEKNPVLLWAHDYREAPIGKVLEIMKDGNRILFKPQFAIDISEKAKQIFEMYKSGIMNAFSVGFIPREWKDEAGANGRNVRTFTRTELLEISAVPVPANPNAVVLARGMKGLSPEIVNELNADFKDPEESACEIHKDFDAVARSMAILMGAGGSTVAAEKRQAEYDHLKSHYDFEKKECPEYSLIEAQVLKDVDVQFEKHIIVEVVKAPDDASLKALQEQITSIHASIAEKNGIDGPGVGAAGSKVDPIDALLSEAGTKRLLQSVDKIVGEILRRGKQQGK